MNLMRFALILVAAALSLSCAAAPPRIPDLPRPDVEVIELVESAPSETALDHADIPNADKVWLDMVSHATKTIDIAQFYVSDEEATRLTPIIDAIEIAVKRKVRVRLLVEEKFFSKYPATIERMLSAGVILKRLTRFADKDGILHAKYFVVDGSDVFLGSQNFDWRALEHIQEIGVRVRSEVLGAKLTELFEQDWDFPKSKKPSPGTSTFPMRAYLDSADVTLSASPKGALPDESTWDLPRLVSLIDHAAHKVHVQVLTYSTTARDGSHFSDLHDALLRAAKRNVKVELLVSSWMRKENGEALNELSKTPNVLVKVITIPAWSGGEIPFARVSHAKYMTVDGTDAWVGSSNWEGSYFTACRNVGVFVKSEAFAKKLDSVFESGWTSNLSSAW